MRLSAVACTLALGLAACGTALPTAPPHAAMSKDSPGIREAELASIEVIKGASAATLYGTGCTASVRIVTRVKTTGARPRGRFN